MDTTNKPVALTQADILGILQDAYSVPLGQPIFNSSEEYNKLKAIIESAIRYTHPVKEHFEDEPQAEELYEILQSNSHPVKELTDEEIDELSKEVWERPWLEVHRKFARAILRKAQEK